MSISLGEQLGTEFRHIGPVVPFTEAEVKYEQVCPLYEVVTEKFLPVASSRIQRADAYTTAVAGSVMLRPFARAEFEEPSRSVTVLLAHDAHEEGWRMKARVVSHIGTMTRRSKVVLYDIATRGERVFGATKAAGFILQRTYLGVADGEFMETTSVERKKYEKPMDEGDCQRLGLLIDRAARRAPFKFPML